MREGMVLQGERPKGSVPGATTRPGSGNRSSALFGDKVVTSTIVTYDIDQPSLAWWPGEPELRRGRAWREEPPCRATQTLHGADDVAGSTSFRIGCVRMRAIAGSASSTRRGGGRRNGRGPRHQLDHGGRVTAQHPGDELPHQRHA